MKKYKITKNNRCFFISVDKSMHYDLSLVYIQNYKGRLESTRYMLSRHISALIRDAESRGFKVQSV